MQKEKVRTFLAQKGMTQKQLAARVGVGESAVSLWLSGKREPTMSKLKRLCEALGCKAEDVW